MESVLQEKKKILDYRKAYVKKRQLWKPVEIVHKLYSNIVLTLYGMIRIVCACLTALGLGYQGKVLEGGNNVFTFFRRHFHILNLGVCVWGGEWSAKCCSFVMSPGTDRCH